MRAAKPKVKPIPRRSVKHRPRQPQQTMVLAPPRPTVAEAIEKVLIGGDLSHLSVEQRLEYYNAVCKSLGLNPLTRPFEYIAFRETENSPPKVVLYARKDCTEQLRKIHSIAITESSGQKEDGLYTVSVKAQDKTGRTDTGTGCVSIEGLKGKALANAIMKCETKAKRRATLSMAGLGFLDESELDSVGEVGTFTEGGRIAFAKPKEETVNPHLSAYEQREQEGLAKLTPAQKEVVERRMKEAEKKKTIPDVEYVDPAQSRCEECGSSFGVHLVKCSQFKNPHMTEAKDDSLYYKQIPGKEDFEITGSLELKKQNRDILGPLYVRVTDSIIATPQQLGHLLAELERRKVPIKAKE